MLASSPSPYHPFMSRQTSTPPYNNQQTPSPTHRRPLLVHNMHDNALQSPFRSPRPGQSFGPVHDDDDDEDASIFLDSSPGVPFSPNITSSISSNAPSSFRTPVKRNTFPSEDHELSLFALDSASHMLGTKRKQANPYTTPLRSHTLAPLRIASPPGSALHRLAPLPAPRYSPETPTKAETEKHLSKQTVTMIHLCLSESSSSATADSDSGCDLAETEDDDEKVFFDTRPSLPIEESLGKKRGNSLLNAVAAGKGNGQDEVAEAVSPGGHITKRRARSRPVSLELLESVKSPASPQRPSPSNNGTAKLKSSRSFATNTQVAFPTAPRFRTRTESSNSTSSTDSVGSPMPRRTRVSGGVGKIMSPHSVRQPLNRMESTSSASLFFGGPKITDLSNNSTPQRQRTTTATSPAVSPTHRRQARPVTLSRPTIHSRHSYAGPLRGVYDLWGDGESPTRPSKSERLLDADLDLDEAEDEFFTSNHHSDSFIFKLTHETPSPRSKKHMMIPKKFKPRDSGIAISDDDEAGLRMPRASTSVNTLYSDDDALVTPGFGPDEQSGWPSIADGSSSFGGLNSLSRSFDVDAFIVRTLAAGGKGSAEDGKKIVPGTPVKKAKVNSYLMNNRPWQSAVTHKVGLHAGVELPGSKKGGKKIPRKSLPAAFPALGKPNLRLSLDSDSETEEADSPSGAGGPKYTGLGIGRPGALGGKPNALSGKPTRWLLRRSSSGQFSSGSDTSLMGTPTKLDPKDGHRLTTLFSDPKSSLRSTSNSSNSSIVTLNSPTPHANLPRKSSSLTTAAPISSLASTPSRLRRDFDEVEEVGKGEFGRVCKVRRKADGQLGEVFAIKTSKRFEGPKHRLRLREEVDILQHLSSKADANGRHPNVLAYIDSWEENEALYIQTELCELGNFGRFLWEYGKQFPQLDEARTWKIIADLSNGLRFIHDSGVIHMDLKPSNIFVTGEGRFKIGDFGMASLWPRPKGVSAEGFEREGDKLYLAPEVLQGTYSKAADVFSFGMTILETATNIIVPDQGDPWQRLRQEDFSQIDTSCGSAELLDLIYSMMRTDPFLRIDIRGVCSHPVVERAREAMQSTYEQAKKDGRPMFCASPLAGVSDNFLDEILGHRPMDLSP